MNPPSIPLRGTFSYTGCHTVNTERLSSFQTITVDLMDNRLGCMDKLVTTKKQVATNLPTNPKALRLSHKLHSTTTSLDCPLDSEIFS